MEKLIAQLDTKLPRKVVGYQRKPYLELWNISINYYLAPIRQSINHQRKMKLAWMAKGNAGLLEYIEPYIINKRKFAVVQKLILAIK